MPNCAAMVHRQSTKTQTLSTTDEVLQLTGSVDTTSPHRCTQGCPCSAFNPTTETSGVDTQKAMPGSFPFNSGMTLPLGCRLGSFELSQSTLALVLRTARALANVMSRAWQKSTVLHTRPTIRDRWWCSPPSTAPRCSIQNRMHQCERNVHHHTTSRHDSWGRRVIAVGCWKYRVSVFAS